MLSKLRGVVDVGMILFRFVELNLEDLIMILKGNKHKVSLLQKLEINLDGSYNFRLVVLFKQ